MPLEEDTQARWLFYSEKGLKMLKVQGIKQKGKIPA